MSIEFSPDDLGSKLQGRERFLCFSLDSEEYAIPLLGVREVIAMPDITPVPQTPGYFLGIMNLRGQIISVIDLRMKFGLKADRSEETCVIICDFASVALGVVVSSVNNVLALLPNQVGNKPELSSVAGGTFVKGVVKREHRLVLLIDLAAALGVELARAADAA